LDDARFDILDQVYIPLRAKALMVDMLCCVPVLISLCFLDPIVMLSSGIAI
jgi:hypothetical protein